MAETALPASHPAARRRVMFGLFAADGWPWAIAKSIFWFVVIVTMLGWIPDRAYYFTVGRTVELWPAAPFLKWSLVNFCPPENETVPCPAPAGSTLPWHPAPTELNLPAPRTDGVAAVLGSTYLYVGGTDGSAPKADVYVSHPVGTGNIDKWSAGPALPEARVDAASVTIGSTLFVIGGYGPDGVPKSTVYSLTVANDGTLGEWKTLDKLALPEPRAGASAVTVSDGIVLLGGTSQTAPQNSVWKVQLDATASTGEWKPQMPLFEPNMDGFAAHVGDVIFLVGGTNADGKAVATVQQGLVGGGPNATTKDPNVIDSYWRVSEQTNLPGPRSNMSGFVSNGTIYVQGGSDGTAPRSETYWAVPDANGVIPAWNNMAETDLGQGVEGSSGMLSGAYAFLYGGSTASGPTAGGARTYLAPQEPFFQLGILGATVPGLKLDGEIGQQIGYLNAAGVGTVNFIILILVGYLFNHKEKVTAFMEKRRRRR